MFDINEITKFTNYRFEYKDLSNTLNSIIKEYNAQSEMDIFHFCSEKLSAIKNVKHFINMAIYDRVEDKLYQSKFLVVSDHEGFWFISSDVKNKIHRHSSLNKACLHGLVKLYLSIENKPKRLEYQCYVVTDNSNSINPDEIDNLIINKDSRVSKILIRDLKGRVL